MFIFSIYVFLIGLYKLKTNFIQDLEVDRKNGYKYYLLITIMEFLFHFFTIHYHSHHFNQSSDSVPIKSKDLDNSDSALSNPCRTSPILMSEYKR